MSDNDNFQKCKLVLTNKLILIKCAGYTYENCFGINTYHFVNNKYIAQ